MTLLGASTRAKRRVVASAVLVVALVGCGGASHSAGSDAARPSAVLVARTVHSGGVDRGYGLYVPRDAPRHPPLVVLLHLYLFSTTARTGVGSGIPMLTAAQRDGFAIALPAGVDFSFNGGSCCGTAVRRGLDDVTFVDDVIRDVTRRDGIDARRVYLVGFSNGAFLGYRFACERPQRIAGAAIVEGALIAPECRPDRPVDLLVVHQTGDHTVPVQGTAASVIPGDPVPLPSVADSLDAYLRGARCPTARRRHVARQQTTTVVHCRGRTIESVVRRGGGHRWPASAKGFDAARLVTRFFGLGRE
jgi:polyhydroxybutyrate depolymerase